MTADSIVVSAISVFEFARKVRIGKWPEMAPHVGRLMELLHGQRGTALALDPADCSMAGLLDWPHRDPFDRFLAATALRRRIPIVSADPVFDGLIERVW